MTRIGTIIALAAMALLAPAPTATTAPDAQRSVHVSAASDQAGCPAISRGRGGAARGGCVLKMGSQGIDVSVLTAVGEMPFASCLFFYTVHVDAGGRTLVSGVEMFGDSPCSDAVPCFPRSFFTDGIQDTAPAWDGRLTPDGQGGFLHRVDACLDTCMGRFEGEVVLRLERDARGRWRSLAGEATVGRSGWTFDGAWKVDAPRGFAIDRR